MLTLWLMLGTAALAQSPAGGREKPVPATDEAPALAAGPPASDTLATQIMLDRAGFSPGEIDGRAGANLRRALAAFQRTNGLPESGTLDAATRQQLLVPAANEPPLITYEITEADVAGPFIPALPADLMEQSKLEALGYRNALEALGEKFHASPRLLQQLNKGATFDSAGHLIVVPNVVVVELPAPGSAGRGPAAPASNARGATDASRGRAAAPPSTDGGASATPPASSAPPLTDGGASSTPAASGAATTSRGGRGGAAERRPAVTLVVTKATSSLTVEDENGRVLFHAPVTSGSAHDPLPIGKWKVNGVQRMPPFQYNPDLFWDADPTHSKAKIASGPNNPVGVAWIDISKEHYGIHGTPEPSRVGHVQSHGCVRLTNWDVQRVTQWARPGTAVIFR